MLNKSALMALGLCGIPFLLLPTNSETETHTCTQEKTMEFLIFPKWQDGMEKVSTWRLTRT